MPLKDEVVSSVLPHLRALNQLCESNGARLVVLVPPTLSHDDASAEIQDSAAREGIRVLVPLRPDDVSPAEFHDGFHLNPSGASRFTQRLASDLMQNLRSN